VNLKEYMYKEIEMDYEILIEHSKRLEKEIKECKDKI